MKYVFIGSLILLAASAAFAQPSNDAELTRVEANPAGGFDYAYYLYTPKALDQPGRRGKLSSFVVIPNNTGKINDDIAFHDDDVKQKMSQLGLYLAQGGIVAPVLMPVFPRPATEHSIYTHSLDRDTLTTDKKQFSRFDLQLAAMIKDARERMEKAGIRTEDRVLMQGYSASGMFVNRFVFLHPKLVKAAIVGAPGGWAIAPVAEYSGKRLTFPAGIADLKEVAGKKFDLRSARRVPMFIILGAEDTNDAVPMGDAYDQRESEIVISLFGKTPVERFPHTERLYKQAGLDAEFKLYPKTTHQMSREMRDDQIAFLKRFVR
jgi:dienelactone hydrolase